MTRRSKSKTRKPGLHGRVPADIVGTAPASVTQPMIDTGPDPWPLVEEFYGRLCKHLGTRNHIVDLLSENKMLSEKAKSLEAELHAAKQDREMSQASLEGANERVGDLERKCRGLEGQLERALRAVEEQKTLAIVSFLAEMADVRANQLLFKVLDGKRAGETLRRLVVFLRGKGVEFVHAKGEQFELTDSMQHAYILKEQATLPCRVEVIARGIRMNSHWIVRPQVQVVS